MVVNISGRAYRIWIALPDEAEGDWLEVTDACSGQDAYFTSSDEPIGEDGHQRTSGQLVLGIPRGQEDLYNPWKTEARWAVGNRVLVQVRAEAGELRWLPHSGLYISAPVLPPYPGSWKLSIELADRKTLAENYPAGVGAGLGAALPRSSAVSQQLQAAGLSLTGTVPGTNPNKLPDREDSPVDRAGEMAAAAGGVLAQNRAGEIVFKGINLYPSSPLFTYVVRADDAGGFQPLQASERPTSEVEVVAEGDEEEDPFNPSSEEGYNGGGENGKDPDQNGSDRTASYAPQSTVVEGGGSGVIMTNQRFESWGWSGNRFTRSVRELGCRGLIIPEDVYDAIRDNTPAEISFTRPSPFLILPSLRTEEVSVYEAGREGRLQYKIVTEYKPRGQVLAEYYKANPPNLATQSMPDLLGLVQASQTRIDYDYTRQSNDSDNRGKQGDDTGGQVRRINETKLEPIGTIAAGATDLVDYSAVLTNLSTSEDTEEYWVRRTSKEWEHHTIPRRAGSDKSGSVVALLAVGQSDHQVQVSSSGNAQPPSADRRRADPNKSRERATIRKTATLKAQVKGYHRIRNDYVRTKTEANELAQQQALLRAARQRGLRIVDRLRDEWFDYDTQARIDVDWDGTKYLGVTDLVSFTLAANRVVVVAELYCSATVAVDGTIVPMAQLITPITVAALAEFQITSFPYAFGPLPPGTVEASSNNDFQVREILPWRSLNDFEVTSSDPGPGPEVTVGFWEFEDTDWLDSSGNNYTLEATGTPTIVSGQVGNAVRFGSSTQALSVFTDEFTTFNLALAFAFEVQFYVRFSNLSTGRNFVTINRICQFQYSVSSGSLQFLVRDNGVVPTTVTSSVSIAVDTWYQVVGKYTGSGVELTVDGTTDSAAFSGVIEDDSFGNTLVLRGLASGSTNLDQVKLIKQ